MTHAPDPTPFDLSVETDSRIHTLTPLSGWEANWIAYHGDATTDWIA